MTPPRAQVRHPQKTETATNDEPRQVGQKYTNRSPTTGHRGWPGHGTQTRQPNQTTTPASRKTATSDLNTSLKTVSANNREVEPKQGIHGVCGPGVPTDRRRVSAPSPRQGKVTDDVTKLPT